MTDMAAEYMEGTRGIRAVDQCSGQPDRAFEQVLVIVREIFLIQVRYASGHG